MWFEVLIGVISSGALLNSIFGYWKIGKEKEHNDKWEIKRQACLNALSLVDAWWSNMEGWSIGDPIPQDLPPISEYRKCHNELCISCSSTEVSDNFLDCLAGEISMDMIIELRNSVRKELGIGEELDLDREFSFLLKYSPLISE